MVPAAASEGRALTPGATGRAVPVEAGEVTEPRVGGAEGLVPDVTRAVGFAAAAPPTDGRADDIDGLVAVEDTEGLLACPDTGTTDVRRMAAESAPALAPTVTVDRGTVEVEAERGDFFAAVAGAAVVDFASEVFLSDVAGAPGPALPT